MADLAPYALIYDPSPSDRPSVQDFKNHLEKGTDEAKIDAMKRLLVIMINGDPMPQLLMHIIRFVMPSKNKQLKKLLHFYWEVCPKLNADGTLKQEMILVCNAIRNDLQHPNEYIRGATLRFLCKLHEPELLDPLIPSILSCLEHRHAYVRKNAIFAVYSIAQEPATSHHIPEPAETIQAFLESETDAACIRNAFIALSNLDRERAIAFIRTKAGTVSTLDELLQLAIIEFIRRDAIHNPDYIPLYLKIIFDVLDSSSNTSIYEAANALTRLSSDRNAIKGAATKLIDLAIKEPDNNVKLIVFEQVNKLHQSNPGILNELAIEILAALSSPDFEIREKALKIALSMVTNRNVEDVIKLLKKELNKTLTQDYEKNSSYRQLLIQSIHTCAVRFADVAKSVVELLLDLLSDEDSASSSSAIDVINFVKEVVEIFPNMRGELVGKLIGALQNLRSASAYRSALWIVGEYSLEESEIKGAWGLIRQSLGEVPILASEKRLLDEAEQSSGAALTNGASEEHHKTSKPKVLSDGTYATETIFSSSQKAHEEVKSNRPPLRSFILDGSWFLASVLASTITKLILRAFEATSNASFKNALRAEAMLILISIIRVGESNLVTSKIDEDTVDRIYSCINVLGEGYENQTLDKAFLSDSRKAFQTIVQQKEKQRAESTASERAKQASPVDESVVFRQFATLSTATESSNSDSLDNDLVLASGTNSDNAAEKVTSKLARIVQLTGYSDPVYIEAFMNVHQFDIVLDILIFNQTLETLQNLTVEFSSIGDIRVSSKPSSQNIGPQSFHTLQASFKVSSADAGVIFGNVVYGGASAGDNSIVILNDIHVDIMDYIKPGNYTETEFRLLWSEFEWENNVTISVPGTSLRGFLKYLLKNANFACLTPGALGTTDSSKISESGDDEEDDDCQFLSANLHARSKFSEDALANLSIEINESTSLISGHVRIRSKGQGLALSLGDRVADLQRQRIIENAQKTELR